ncbi:SDR family NAD(P)-dependent oxidoreductase, partial [Pseudomonas aeruginosa]|nr:SDR family NAD(P)-dependent oxidoreductase [Pseudomonas aeruginosa]
CQAMVQVAIERYGQIDILAANAGIFPSAPLAEMTVEQFDHVMNTNMRSTFLCTQAVLPYMKARHFGRIILTSSITGPVTG